MTGDNNNHIIYSAEDIQRYWKGQLSPQEMHAMEKAALDDPFLADALEGMGDALIQHDEAVVTAELDTLRSQLQARTEGGRRTAPVRSFRWWQVAAAALVVLVAGYWIFFTNNSEQDSSNEIVAQQESTTGNKAPIVVPDADSSPAMSKGNAALSDSPAAASVTTEAQRERSDVAGRAAPAEEPGFYQFNTNTPARKQDSLNSLLANQYKRQNFAVNDSNKPLKNQPAAAQAGPPILVNLDSVGKPETEVIQLREDFLAAKQEDNSKETQKLQNIISGVVTDNKNNPLANAYIQLNNSRQNFSTDPLGNFKIPVNDSVVKVSVSLLGYATQNFRLQSTHNGAGILNNQLQLQPSNAELNEVVVAGYGSEKKKGYDVTKGRSSGATDLKLTVQNAQPVYGWLTYEQYLEDNIKRPANNPHLTGEVAISFEVNKKGELSAFQVEKSLAPEHDAEALRVVKAGPAWKLLKGRKARVTVIVRF